MNREKNQKRLAAAIPLLMIASVMAVAPAASAEEPDHDMGLLESDSVASPEELFVPQVCDPVPLVCVGPVTQPLPFLFNASWEDIDVLVWTNEGESTPYGPEWHNQTVPVLGTEVPVVVCPETCPIPVLPEAALNGTVTVLVADPASCDLDGCDDTRRITVPVEQNETHTIPAGSGGTPVLQDLAVTYPTYVPGGAVHQSHAKPGDTILVTVCLVPGADAVTQPVTLTWDDPDTALGLAPTRFQDNGTTCAGGDGVQLHADVIIDNPAPLLDLDLATEEKTSDFTVTAEDDGGNTATATGEVAYGLDGGAVLPFDDSTGPGGTFDGDLVTLDIFGSDALGFELIDPISGEPIVGANL